MPDKKIPYMKQHEAIFDDLKKLMAKSYPETPIRTASAMYPETIENAINELIKENVETIVVCDLFPVYSNLEEFNSLFIEIDHLVAERAKVIYAPSIGAFTSFRSAFVQMARDEITKISSNSKKLFVLTRHGFPEMPGEPYHKLAPAYYDNLQREVATALQGTGTDVVFADTEFAGEDDDPDNKRLSSSEALTMGVDFLSENTDTVYCAREEALEPIGFEYGGKVPYSDFSVPFRTELSKGSTRIILQGKEWPQLISKKG